jgi:hypothetical protein
MIFEILRDRIAVSGCFHRERGTTVVVVKATRLIDAASFLRRGLAVSHRGSRVHLVRGNIFPANVSGMGDPSECNSAGI